MSPELARLGSPATAAFEPLLKDIADIKRRPDPRGVPTYGTRLS